MKLALAVASALVLPNSATKVVELKPPSSPILVPIVPLEAKAGAGGVAAEIALLAKETEAEVSYGRPECPCIGFNNVHGSTMALVGRGARTMYPGDLGGRCEAWDDNLYPADCQEGGTPGKGKGWCAKPWCYVDPRRCDIEVLPTMSSYVPTARYQNMPLFWSYATCQKKGEVEDSGKPGNHGCRCVGFDNLAGSMKVSFNGQKVVFPGETGGTCEAWDMDNSPACAVKGKKPEWCKQKWCFVDPCSCSLEEPPKVSSYLWGSTMQGKTVYYSYETCGGKDSFTKLNKHACVNIENAEDCTRATLCAWNGAKCLGKELVESKTCGSAAYAKPSGSEAEKAKNSASGLRPLAALLALLVARCL